MTIGTGLESGRYDVQAMLPGFRTDLVSVTVGVGVSSLDIVLGIAPLAETVTVTRAEQELSAVPQAVTVVGEDLEQQLGPGLRQRHVAEFVHDQEILLGELLLDAQETLVVPGLEQFVHQRSGGGEAHTIPFLTGRQPQRQRTVGDLNPKTLGDAKRQFVEVYGSALVMNTYLKIALVLVCLVAVGLLALNFYTTTRYANVKPLVIRIDDVGRAAAVQSDSMQYQTHPPELRYFLTQFVVKHFSRMRATALPVEGLASAIGGALESPIV